MNLQEIREVVEDSWRQLDAAIAGLDDAALEEPGVVGTWSIKDVLGHVTTWEQMALRHVEQWRGGETPAGLGTSSIDDYNASEAARRHAWALARVREESADTQQRLRATLESLTEDDWAARTGRGDGERTLGDWVGSALGGAIPGAHAAEHAEQIQAWRDARRAD